MTSAGHKQNHTMESLALVWQIDKAIDYSFTCGSRCHFTLGKKCCCELANTPWQSPHAVYLGLSLYK